MCRYTSTESRTNIQPCRTCAQPTLFHEFVTETYSAISWLLSPLSLRRIIVGIGIFSIALVTYVGYIAEALSFYDTWHAWVAIALFGVSGYGSVRFWYECMLNGESKTSSRAAIRHGVIIVALFMYLCIDFIPLYNNYTQTHFSLVRDLATKTSTPIKDTYDFTL